MGDGEAIVDVDPEVSISVLEEEGISEGLPRVLLWGIPPPSTTRGRSEARLLVAGISATGAGSTTAVGEGRRANKGGAARVSALIQDINVTVTSSPRIQKTGALGSKSLMAYMPASSQSTRRPSGEHPISMRFKSIENA